MKSLTLCASVALACALSLAACGGSSGNLLLSGSVIGLTKPGLQLQNKSGPLLDVAAGATTFTFNELIGNDEDFDVEIKTPPKGASCSLLNNKGKSGAYNITSVVVNCVTDTHELSGTVTGLNVAVDGLVLVNGSNRLVVPAVAANVKTAFKMNKVADGSPYGITVLAQPAGLTCNVENGVGTMATADIGNVVVTCAQAAISPSGASL
jgi:hypothetical protein